MKILNLFIITLLGIIVFVSCNKSDYEYGKLTNKTKYNDTAWFIPVENMEGDYFLMKLVDDRDKIIAAGFANSKTLKPAGEWYMFDDYGWLIDYRLFDKDGKIKVKPNYVNIDDDEPEKDPRFDFNNVNLFLDSIVKIQSEQFILCFSIGVSQTLKSINHIIMIYEDEGITDSVVVESKSNPFFTINYNGKLPSHIQINSNIYENDTFYYSDLEKPFQLDTIKTVTWKGKLSELNTKSFNLRQVMEYALEK